MDALVNQHLIEIFTSILDFIKNAPYVVLIFFYSSIKRYFDKKTEEKQQLAEFLKNANETQIKHNERLNTHGEVLLLHEKRLNDLSMKKL
jgi:hypothetical protein